MCRSCHKPMVIAVIDHPLTDLDRGSRFVDSIIHALCNNLSPKRRPISTTVTVLVLDVICRHIFFRVVEEDVCDRVDGLGRLAIIDDHSAWSFGRWGESLE